MTPSEHDAINAVLRELVSMLDRSRRASRMMTIAFLALALAVIVNLLERVWAR
jgi:hypothetical protein